VKNINRQKVIAITITNVTPAVTNATAGSGSRYERRSCRRILYAKYVDRTDGLFPPTPFTTDEN